MPEVTTMLKTPKMLKTIHRVKSIRARALAAMLAIVAIVAAPAALAEHLDKALGADGQIYQVTAGLYGALFPNGHVYGAATPVLALDTTVPGSPTRRQLVQGTSEADVESAPALIYEDGSRTLFVVWVATTHSVNTAIKLTSYDGKQWSTPITIVGNPYSPKTPPQLAVTRDTHQEVDAASGKPVTRHRTVLHLVWSEDTQSGFFQAYYAPIIFEDGVWIGSVPEPARLNAFDLAEQAPQAAGSGPFDTPLVRTPALQGGRDTSTVVAGFASGVSGMLTTVEVDVLPEELRMLADTCSAAVLANSQYFPDHLDTLAGKVTAVILGSGSAFQPEALQAVAGEAQSQITAGAADVAHLAEKTRATIVDIGARFSMRGLRINFPGPIAPPKIAEISAPNQPSHFLQYRVTATRPSPPVTPDGLQLFLSRTGADALAAWTGTASNSSGAGGTSAQASSALLYTSTQPDGTWSSVHQLQLSDSMSLQQAYQVLAQRMQY
jgi:hypothetical protein